MGRIAFLKKQGGRQSLAAGGTSVTCRLLHPGGWVLECDGLPPAAWIAAVLAGEAHAAT